MQLLDVAGNSSTADDGKRVFLLSDFICSTQNLFAAPVNLVATPRSEKPCYTTTTSKLVPHPSLPGFFNDVQITVLTAKIAEGYRHPMSASTGAAGSPRPRSFSEARRAA